MTDKKTTGNSTYPKGGGSCSKDSLVVNQTLVFQMKFCGKSPALRVAAKRYVQPYDDQHSYINRQKTKDKMPTLRKIKRGASLHTRQRFCTTFNFTQPHPKPTHHPTNANFAEWN
jgi:hypothetical protein